MGFNVDKFTKEKFAYRQETISDGLEVLAPWFDGKGPVSWTVRGLNAAEISKAENLARGGREQLEKAVTLLINSPNKAKAEDVAVISEGLDFMTHWRIELLAIGSVDPEIDVRTSRKLSDAFPTEFRRLADTVLGLSGRGQVTEEKSKPSGSEKTSKPA